MSAWLFVEKLVVYGLAYGAAISVFGWAWMNGFVLHCRDRLRKRPCT